MFVVVMELIPSEVEKIVLEAEETPMEAEVTALESKEMGGRLTRWN